MSAMGHKRTLTRVRIMSALPPKADSRSQSQNVRFGPIRDILGDRAAGIDETV
jgi:hypothetical protein